MKTEQSSVFDVEPYMEKGNVVLYIHCSPDSDRFVPSSTTFASLIRWKQSYDRNRGQEVKHHLAESNFRVNFPWVNVFSFESSRRGILAFHGWEGLV